MVSFRKGNALVVVASIFFKVSFLNTQEQETWSIPSVYEAP